MITVIIPTFNHEKCLPRALAAVLLQGKFIKRIIVINDGSQDGTDELMRSIIKYENKIFYINLEHVGLVTAINVGLKYVETEYFALAAADDFLMPDWAEQSLKTLDSYPKASICVSNTYCFFEDKAVIWKNIFPREIKSPYLTEIQFKESLVRHGIWFNSNTVVFRASEYNSSFFIDELNSFSDGILLALHGLKSGVCVVQQPLGCFIKSDTSLSGSLAATNSSLQLIPKIGDCLFFRFTGLIDAKVASKILNKCIFIYLNESVNYIFNSYRSNILKYMDARRGRLLYVYFYILQIFIYMSLFLMLRIEDLLKLEKRIIKVKTAEERQCIESWEFVLSQYWSDYPGSGSTTAS